MGSVRRRRLLIAAAFITALVGLVGLPDPRDVTDLLVRWPPLANPHWDGIVQLWSVLFHDLGRSALLITGTAVLAWQLRPSFRRWRDRRDDLAQRRPSHG